MRLVSLTVLGLAAAACAPDLENRASAVTFARIVGVRAEPAEARPGQNVTWTAVIVSPDGEVAGADVGWTLCVAPRGPSDSITVSSSCYGQGRDTDAGGKPLLVPFDATGLRIRGKLPSDLCSTVGPQLPPIDKQGNPQRPPVADVTGGYQVPVRTILDTGDVQDVAFYRQRLNCSLANAPAVIAKEYAARYTLNKHPTLASIDIDGNALPTSGARADVPSGGSYTLQVSWPEEAVETYPVFDSQSASLVERSENLDVTWFTNGGSFERDRTTPGSDGLSSSNVLKLDAGRTDPVTVWILVHDDRGGLVSSTLTLNPV